MEIKLEKHTQKIFTAVM